MDFTRTYADTSYLNLPAGEYDLEAKPLENSDINAIIISKVQSYSEKEAHQTINFDGGIIKVSTFNNQEGWDSVVRVISKTTGKKSARGLTYGLETSYLIEDVEVEGGEIKEVSLSFKSGIAMIGAKTGTELVDATLNIYEVSTNKNVATGRTYTSNSNNPKKFILNPGTYNVLVTTLGKYKGLKETITIKVKAGEKIKLF